MNGKLLRKTKFKNLYIPPDPGDGGGAMGAALYIYYTLNQEKLVQFNPYLGPEFPWFEVKKILDKHKMPYSQFADENELLVQVADLLAQGNIIGWFQGRMEWGPRALGNRSILSSAKKAKMKEIINVKIKKREEFRPFAPVVLEEKTNKYFITDQPLPICSKYMLLVYDFSQKGIKSVPATVHVDGTGRLQTVAKEDNYLYYSLIKEYDKKVGTPILINTSFNVQEPIVCTPEDAVRCFINTDLDAMVIDSYLVTKRPKHVQRIT